MATQTNPHEALGKQAANGDTAAREELTRLAESGDENARRALGENELDDRYTKTGRERKTQ